MAVNYQPITSTAYSGSSEHHFPVYNAATGKVITHVAGCDVSAVSSAVAASQAAFQEWSAIPPLQRGVYLFKAADALEARAEELATILCMENGKPRQDGRNMDVNFLIYIFRYFGGLIGKLPGELYDRGATTARTIHEPYGVTVGILPFNWPPIHTGGKIAPAIAAGNTMILKPGEQTPLTVLKIVEIIQTVLPKDVVIALPAKGIQVPQALVNDPLVKLVSFTGSTGGGISVAQLAADTLTTALLELGGKNALIVFEDANLDRAVQDALEGAFFNKGEACTAASRLLVHESVHDEFCQRLSRAVNQLVVGDGMDVATHVGPLVSKAAQERVRSYIDLGKTEGATVAAQAPIPTASHLDQGFFVPATLFTNVTSTMRIAKEEIFGPVATVTKFSSEDEALSIANSVDYGLTAIIFSQNQERCSRLARKLDAGMIWFNQYDRSAVMGTPFGGTKKSGNGREHCIDTLKEYSWAKTIHEPSGLGGGVRQWRGVKDCFDKAN